MPNPNRGSGVRASILRDSIPESVKSKAAPKKKTKRYVSKDGFETVRLVRGFSMIRPLWSVIQEVSDRSKKECFICGGYARWCASPKYNPAIPKDLDIYCEDTKTFDILVSELYGLGLRVEHDGDMALTFAHPTKGEFHTIPPIQVIKPMKKGAVVTDGGVINVLSNFDFTIVRAAISTPTQVLVDADFLHDEVSNVLRLKNIHCPVSSLLRCIKYTNKGYWLSPVESLKLFEDWMNRPQSYRDKITGLVTKLTADGELSKKEIEELEALMRID